jgi:hypothetical protein
MMNESLDVRLARVEEGLVHCHKKFDHAETRAELRHSALVNKLDLLTDRHWKLYAKMTGIAAVMALVVKFIKLGG